MGRKFFGLPRVDTHKIVHRTVAAAVVGGTISKIGGGKFANGAATAAMVHLFNAEGVGKRPEKEKVVAGIYGAGGPNAGDNPELEALVTEKGGRMFRATEKGELIKFLSAGAAEGKEVVLLGYSRGGNAAIDITNTLGKKGINVSLLVTFDPHSLSDSKIFQLKYDNVGRAYNFYQRNPRTGWGGIGWWGRNPYWGSPVSSSYIDVKGVNFTGTSVSHLNIIQHSTPYLKGKL